MPDTIQFSSGSQSIYTYAADGTKQKIVYKTSPEDITLPVTSLDQVLQTVSNAKITSTDYCGNYIYENDTLKMILTPEGYVQNGVYYYYLKDHLGSNRVVLRQDGTIVERDNYYPSGARFGESVLNGGSVQPYRHIGMEMQSMHGLNWIDNGARMRTVGLPAFTTMDPLAEKYYSISPYAYAVNNPIYYVDPLGMNVVENDKSYTISGYDVYTYFGVLQEIANGYSSMNTLQSALHNAAQKNKGKGGKMDQTLDEFTVTASAPKKQGEAKEERSWLYPIIGKLDGNRYLDSRINPYIPSSKEINSEVDMEMQIGLLFTPADVVGIAASTLAKLGYSATEQFLLKSILYAMEHSKAVYNGFKMESFTVGFVSGYYSGPYLPTSPDLLPSINPWFDTGLSVEQSINMILALPQQHEK